MLKKNTIAIVTVVTGLTIHGGFANADTLIKTNGLSSNSPLKASKVDGIGEIKWSNLHLCICSVPLFGYNGTPHFCANILKRLGSLF